MGWKGPEKTFAGATRLQQLLSTLAAYTGQHSQEDSRYRAEICPDRDLKALACGRSIF